MKVLALVLVSIGASGCSLVLKDPASILAPADVASGGTISRADALDDLDALIRTLEQVHPDPYRFRSRETLNAERQRVVASMPASLTSVELCTRLSAVLATLSDGHTWMACDSLVLRDWQRAANATLPQAQQVRMFPLSMRLDDQQHLIVSWPYDTPGVERGDRLLRINGHDADALVTEWAREVSHDSDAGRLDSVARGFWLQLALHGVDPPFRVTLAAPGAQSRDVSLQGDPVNYIWERPPPQPAPVRTSATPNTSAVAVQPVVSLPIAAPPAVTSPVAAQPIELRTDFFTYKMIEPGIAYMDFVALLDGRLFGNGGRFKKAVDAMFRRISSDKPHTLIIDIRRNEGGNEENAGELFRHFTEKPFRLLSSSQVKRSKETRSIAKSLFRIPFRWLPLWAFEDQYFRGEVGTLSPPLEEPQRARPRAEPFFSGPVCVLTGPRTYSAAVHMAEAVKTFGLATIVGEETGGQPNSFGNAFVFPLPKSGLSVKIATFRTVRANGRLEDFNSVVPDIIVRTTAADIRAGFDPVLERAKRCPPIKQ